MRRCARPRNWTTSAANTPVGRLFDIKRILVMAKGVLNFKLNEEAAVRIRRVSLLIAVAAMEPYRVRGRADYERGLETGGTEEDIYPSGSLTCRAVWPPQPLPWGYQQWISKLKQATRSLLGFLVGPPRRAGRQVAEIISEPDAGPPRRTPGWCPGLRNDPPPSCHHGC